jgi:putative DNA primase/helicase
MLESANLLAVVTVNGRSKCSLLVYAQSDKATPLLVEELNLTAFDQRATAVGRLAEPYREEAGPLLAQLATVVAKERTKSKAKAGGKAESSGLEPWPDLVNGEELLASLEGAFRRFLVLSRPEFYDAAALWAVFAHAHDAFQFSPILIATSPERESGKSRLLEILKEITPRPWLILSPSDAVIFRKIDRDCPTLLLDEGDNVSWRDRPELLSILNGGFQRKSASVPRCVGEGASLEVRDFTVWCPKAMACLKSPLPDTTMSRSIVLRLARKTSSETCDNLRLRLAAEVLGPIQRQAARWATDHLDALRVIEPVMPDGLSDRTADAWEPLFAIADLVGGDWPKRARAAALLLSGKTVDTESYGAQLLADLHEVFTEKDTDRLPTKEILEALVSRDDRPWVEWVGGRGQAPKPLSARGLSRLLHPFGIGPRATRDGPAVFKGYLKADFKDAWARYLPSISVTSVTSPQDNDLQQNLSVTPTILVTDRKSANSLAEPSVTDVTDRKVVVEEEERLLL